MACCTLTTAYHFVVNLQQITTQMIKEQNKDSCIYDIISHGGPPYEVDLNYHQGNNVSHIHMMVRAMYMYRPVVMPL